VKKLKGIRIAILIVVLLLGLNTPGVLSKDNSFAVEYKFDFATVDGQWIIEDTFLQEIPGEPLIPYYPARILLPQDTEVKHIMVKHSKPILEAGFDIPWGQPPCTFSDTPVKVGRNEKIYSSNKWYPKEIYEIVSTESFRGFQILNINLYPLQYKPKSQTVKFYPKLYVYVQVGKGAQNELYRGLKSDKEAVRDMVDNPEVAETYEEKRIPLATEEYIIITSSTLESTFQDLATWKASYVNGASVYTTTWIYNNYNGTDSQMKIRNFIIDKWEYNGLKYVLLGGDTGVVPYRGFYIYSGGYTDYDMAADMYYSHLNGNWDTDGDGKYGEPGEEDWYADVAVGRAPVDNTTEAAAFVNKVISYECMDKPARVCFHQSRVMSDNSPDSRCLAWNCDDWIPGGYTIDYLFEEDGTVSKTDWRNAWAAGPIAVVHIGHGNTDVYYINYEIGGTVSWYGSDVSSMTNTFFPWTTSVACICGEFEASDCLAEQYVKDDCGAIGAIYNDNYGWFSTQNACQFSGEFCEMEIRACWSDGYEKLGDLLNRSRYYLVGSASSNSTYRWCFYERNLIGDPESPCLTKRDCGSPPPPNTVSITYPEDGSEVYGTIDITVCALGCIDTVEIYINDTNGDPLCTRPIEHLQCIQCEWDTTDYPEDTAATIIAIGYCSGVPTDDDQVTVTVNNYYIKITAPEEGETVFETVIITTDTRNISVVEFWINGELVEIVEGDPPFQYIWDTCKEPNGNYTITAKGFYGGQLVDQDQVRCHVFNIPFVVITDPVEGEEVYDTVTIYADASCINIVEFYIDGGLICTVHDTEPPFEFQCNWDTTDYEDGPHTISVKGYYYSVFKSEDQITVTVNNHHIDITSPPNRSTFSIGETINITTSTTDCIDTVKFYLVYIIDDENYGVNLLLTDDSPPFEYPWDTTVYWSGFYTIRAHAYSSDELKNVDQVLIRLLSII
jgi:hypothetical protein